LAKLDNNESLDDCIVILADKLAVKVSSATNDYKPNKGSPFNPLSSRGAKISSRSL
jgi:hypothetical protein